MNNEQTAMSNASTPQVDSVESHAVENNITDNSNIRPSSSESIAKAKKMFDEDRMKVISNNAKQSGFQEGIKAGEEKIRAEYEEKLAKLNNTENVHTDSASNNSANYNEDYIKKIVQEHIKESADKQQQEIEIGINRQVENEFVSKIAPVLQANPEVAEKLAQLGFDKFNPAIKADVEFVRMLNSVDNVADVIVDIANNPKKMLDLKALYMAHPQFALNSLNELSSSIKANKEALDKERAPAPSSQLKPSTIGLGDGSVSVSTLRQDKKYRW